MAEAAALNAHFANAGIKAGSFDPARVGRNMGYAVGKYTPVPAAMETMLHELPATSEIHAFVDAYRPLIAKFADVITHPNVSELERVTHNQEWAKGLFVAHSWRKDATVGLEGFMKTIGVMHTEGITLGSAMYQYLLGAKAHAGIMLAFEANGYKLFMPETPEELLLWDAKGSTDFAAVHPDGYLVLGDAKGAQRLHDDNRLPIRLQDDDPWKYSLTTRSDRIKSRVATDVMSRSPFSPRRIIPAHFEITYFDEYMSGFGQLNKASEESAMVHSIERRLQKLIQ